MSPAIAIAIEAIKTQTDCRSQNKDLSIRLCLLLEAADHTEGLQISPTVLLLTSPQGRVMHETEW